MYMYMSVGAHVCTGASAVCHTLTCCSIFPLTPDQLYRLQGRSGHTVSVIQTAAPRWRRLAYSLHLPGAVVDSIELSSQFQAETACERALRHWMTTATRQPVVWGTLLQALRDADLNTLATDLEHVLREGND